MPPRIIGVGGYLPKNIISNQKLSKTVDTNDEWIQSRTGIKQRHIADASEKTSDMACNASKEAISKAGINISEVDLIIACSTTHDNNFPGIANQTALKLGLTNTPAIDLNDACSGFVNSIHIANSLMQTNSYRNTLIVCAEKMSSIVDWQDRSTCVLFGDGAGAVILNNSRTKSGIIDSIINSNAGWSKILHTNAKSTDSYSNKGITMKGNEVFRHAVEKMSSSIIEILDKNNMSLEDVDYIVPHQANIRILNSIASRLSLPKEKVIATIDKHANCSPASIPLALAEIQEHNTIKKGNIVILTAFGAGANWGSILLRW